MRENARNKCTVSGRERLNVSESQSGTLLNDQQKLNLDSDILGELEADLSQAMIVICGY